MNDPALSRYLKTCCCRLNPQRQALTDDFSLRTCTAIEVVQTLGVTTMDLPGRGRAIATIIPIARDRPSNQEWCWVGSESEPFQLHRHSAIALQSLAPKTGLKREHIIRSEKNNEP